MTKRILGLKVLDADMRSCNGGDMAWKLGEWYSVKGQIRICQRGLHMTYHLDRWSGTRVFIAETTKIYVAGEDKVVCRRMRLLRELTPALYDKYLADLKLIRDKYEADLKPIRDKYEAEFQVLLAAMLKEA